MKACEALAIVLAVATLTDAGGVQGFAFIANPTLMVGAKFPLVSSLCTASRDQRLNRSAMKCAWQNAADWSPRVKSFFRPRLVCRHDGLMSLCAALGGDGRGRSGGGEQRRANGRQYYGNPNADGNRYSQASAANKESSDSRIVQPWAKPPQDGADLSVHYRARIRFECELLVNVCKCAHVCILMTLPLHTLVSAIARAGAVAQCQPSVL
jgi:hypothetical protein